MPLYDGYEQYRQPLTEKDDILGIQEAEERRGKMLEGVEKGELRRADDGKGFIHPREPDVYLPDPVAAEHVGIAMNRAEEQFRGWDAMPEDVDVTMRYPGIDPVGKYSVIDMKFAQRLAQVKAVLQTRSPEVQAYARELMEATNTNRDIQSFKFSMEAIAQRHRIVTRASKLCLDPDGRELLHKQARVMETDMSVTLYDQYLQGVEYAAGVRTGPVPQEVQDFYSQHMQPLNTELVKQAAQMTQAPREISVEFEDLEHKLQQQLFANPRNWGKTPREVTVQGLDMDAVGNAIPPYARATARRVLDPLFRTAETLDDEATINRGDLIIIDGKTVREKMYEDFVAAGRKPLEFYTFYQANYQKAASEYVAAGLMAGKRVEAFIPDKDGKIPKEPTQITKTGYEPKALQKVVLNAWERFWSKRGFFKEKTAQAAEYQRMVEARERVQATHLKQKLFLDGPPQPRVKDAYLRDWHEPVDGGPYRFSVTRSAITSTAVCALLHAGYNMKDIFDQTKLLDEKAAMGREVLQRMKDDQHWLGEQMFHGQEIIADSIDLISNSMRLTDPKQLYQEKNGILFFAAQVAFDISQEKDHIKAGYEAAAERSRPGHGPEAAVEVDSRALNVGAYFDSAKKALDASVTMASGLGDNLMQKCLGPIATFEVFRQKNLNNPGTFMSRQYDADTCLQATFSGQMMANDKNFKALGRQLEGRVEDQKAFGRQMLSGEMQERLQVTVDLKKGK